jgi:hypothetical protein
MEADREMAAAIQKDEEAKQVRFEFGRAEYRAKERAENTYAQIEKRRAEEREEIRRHRQEEDKERAKKEAAKEARRKAERVKEEIERKEREVKKAERAAGIPTRTSSKRHSRRQSMSQEQIAERDRALAETHAQMARERAATEQREREEQAASLVEQQKTTGYYNARGPPPTAYTIVNDGPGVGRRNSTSRRNSITSSGGPPVAFGQNRPRRVSIVQDTPPVVPPINTSFPQPYGSRPSSSHGANAMFSTVSVQPGYVRGPSARHSSYDKPNPFAQPPPATGNPFAQQGSRPPSRDFWAQDPREQAPTHTRQNSDDRQHTLHRRGKEVIERSDGKVRKHDRARQATVNMGKVVGFEGDYVDSDDENEEDKLAGYGPGLGLNKSRKKKH